MHMFTESIIISLPPQVKCKNRWGGKKILRALRAQQVTAPGKKKSSARPWSNCSYLIYNLFNL